MGQVKHDYNVIVDELGKEVYLLQELIHLLYAFNLHDLQYTIEGDLLYRILWHTTIIAIARLIDETRGAVSVVQLLKENYNKNKDSLSDLEKDILLKMGFVFSKNSINLLSELSFIAKIKKMRNKFGIAHLDKIIILNKDKKQKLYDENKITIDDVRTFSNVLRDGFNCLSQRSSDPISLLHQDPSRVNKLIDRFKSGN